MVAGFQSIAPVAHASDCTPSVSTNNDRTVLTFTSSTPTSAFSCAWQVPNGVSSLRILAVGGGGGGGNGRGGGGGGGGVAYTSFIQVNSGDGYVVNIGNGGAAAVSEERGGLGGNTSLVRNSDSKKAIEAGGGGGGGSHHASGISTLVGNNSDGGAGASATFEITNGAAAGGNGGGSAMSYIALDPTLTAQSRWWWRGGAAGSATAASGVTGTTASSFAGGGSYRCPYDSTNNGDNRNNKIRVTGGGAGANGDGKGNGTTNPQDNCNNYSTITNDGYWINWAPNAGAGVTNSITGSSVLYGNGGGGADGRGNGEGGTFFSMGRGDGTSGGSGEGQAYYAANASSPYTAYNWVSSRGDDNRGHGGGGGVDTASRGGSGVLIISYYSMVFNSAAPIELSTVQVDSSTSKTFSNITFDNALSGTTYLVSVSLSNPASGASLSLANNAASTTASYGYTQLANGTSFTTAAFTVTGANINSVMQNLKLTSGTTTSSNSQISISVTQSSTNLAVNPDNGHFYKAITYSGADDKTRTTAASNAASNIFGNHGGYLVTITSDAENDFVSANIPNASNIWIGASDAGNEGLWKYDQGPENGTVIWRAPCYSNPAGQSNSCGGATGYNSYDGVGGVWQNWSTTNHNKWCMSSPRDGRETNAAGSEPNNASGVANVGENYAVTNWNGSLDSTYAVGSGASTTHKCWNDLQNAYSGVQGYVVEWDQDTTPFDNSIKRTFYLAYNSAISLKSLSRYGVDPRKTTFDLTNASIKSGPTNVVSCVYESDSSGTYVNAPSAVLVFDIPSSSGTYGSSDTTTTAGGTSVSMAGDYTSWVTMAGTQTAINSLLSKVKITRNATSKHNTTKYVAVATMSKGYSDLPDSVCDDTNPTQVKLVVKLDPILLTARRSTSVTVRHGGTR